MRVLVWIVEETWQATVAAAAALLPADADVTLLHVTASDAETVARGARCALLGRSRRPTAEPLDAISEQGARDLLADAQAVLGREALLDARSGRIEHEVVAAAGTADLLVLARDEGHAHRGPRSLGPTARYVVDHAPCAVLLIWPDPPSR
jgi:nucleotide-binding universal stress UspA family protein